MKLLAATVYLSYLDNQWQGEIVCSVPKLREQVWACVHEIISCIRDQVQAKFKVGDMPSVGLYLEIDTLEKVEKARLGFWSMLQTAGSQPLSVSWLKMDTLPTIFEGGESNGKK